MNRKQVYDNEAQDMLIEEISRGVEIEGQERIYLAVCLLWLFVLAGWIRASSRRQGSG